MVGDLNNDDPIIRIFALGRINNPLRNFQDKALTYLDRRLLKGFYISDKLELEHDDYEQNKKLVLGRGAVRK